MIGHTDRKSVEQEITEILQNIPEEKYLKTFNRWLERMELCIKNQGDYFEFIINKYKLENFILLFYI